MDWGIAPDGERLVYNSAVIIPSDDGFGDEVTDIGIYRAPVGRGSHPQRLDQPVVGGENVVEFRLPIFSADGETAYFRAIQKSSGLGGVYRASLDGEELERIADYSAGATLSFGPLILTEGGAKLIYQHKASQDVEVVPTDGGA